jgi:hypothetical protein
MTRRGRARHFVRHASFGQRVILAASSGKTIALFALGNELTVDSEQLHAYDTAILSASQVAVAAASGVVDALVIEIDDIHPNVL